MRNLHFWINFLLDQGASKSVSTEWAFYSNLFLDLGGCFSTQFSFGNRQINELLWNNMMLDPQIFLLILNQIILLPLIWTSMLEMEKCWWPAAISWRNQMWNTASLLGQCHSPPSASVISYRIPSASVGFYQFHLSPQHKGPWERSSESQKHPASSNNLLEPFDQGMLLHNSTLHFLSTQPFYFGATKTAKPAYFNQWSMHWLSFYRVISGQ